MYLYVCSHKAAITILKAAAGAETMLLHFSIHRMGERRLWVSKSDTGSCQTNTALLHVGKGKHLGGSAQAN